jgi:hypothetical protein
MQTVSTVPQVFIELRPSDAGCYVRATIERALDQLPRMYAGAHGTRREAITEATAWALGWLSRLGEGSR